MNGKLNNDRYQVIKGSESCHCCFEATVLDTAKVDEDGDPENICECFDAPRAHAIADAMNTADEAPLNEKRGPVYQDRCGKEFDVHSALMYFPGGIHDPAVVLPCQSEYDINTGRWKMYITTVVEGHEYMVRGTMFKKHPQLLKLEASGEDIQREI